MVRFCGRVDQGRIVEQKLFYGVLPTPNDGSVWLPQCGCEPNYNPEYQKLVGPRYQITDTAINLFWDVVDLPLPTVQSNHKSKLAAIRYAYATAGTFWTDPNGVTQEVDTTDDVVIKLVGACLMSLLAQMQGHPFSLQWKFGSQADAGFFITLTSEVLITVFLAASNHVQMCYQNESDLTYRINAAHTPEEVMAVDITKGWPVECCANPPDISAIMAPSVPIDTSVPLSLLSR